MDAAQGVQGGCRVQGECNTRGTRAGTRAVTACGVCPVADGEATLFTNVAVGKPAVQSSTLFPKHRADLAVDGRRQIPCSKTDNSAQWWQVDLNATFCVVTVTMDNREQIRM